LRAKYAIMNTFRACAFSPETFIWISTPRTSERSFSGLGITPADVSQTNLLDAGNLKLMVLRMRKRSYP
jgi:hypothetical protein